MTIQLLKKALGKLTISDMFLKLVIKLVPNVMIGGKEYISFVESVDITNII